METAQIQNSDFASCASRLRAVTAKPPQRGYGPDDQQDTSGDCQELAPRLLLGAARTLSLIPAKLLVTR
jgi:hypothetical protein